MKPSFVPKSAVPRALGSLAFAALLVLGHVPIACAWGSEGHEAVATLAYTLLTPPARSRVDVILALEPGATLASISNWADVTRNRATAPWHYVNLPRDANCEYSAARECPDGRCIVEALRRHVQRLATLHSPEGQLEALKYVVHFVADIHQPLHAGFADDRGGNDYQLLVIGRGTNLHALWDTFLPRQIGNTPDALAALLQARTAPTASMTFAPAVWAAESCRVVSSTRFYPDRRPAQEALDRYAALASDRLQLAAWRLAATLDEMLTE